MTAITAMVAAAIAGASAFWLARRPPGGLRRHTAENYRGRTVVIALGAVLVVPLVIGAAAARSFEAFVIAGGGLVFAVLGLVDDLHGSKESQGFSGHLRALASGRVTTGLVKAAGGGLTGLAVAAGVGERGLWIIASGAVVALTANLFNLLDTRPGRAAKLWLVAAGVVALAAGGGPLVLLAAVFGGVLGFLPADLAERGMLGDTGSNLVGAVLGGVLVTALPDGPTAGVLVVLAVLTVLSEAVSFGKIIERTPGLREFDRLGQR